MINATSSQLPRGGADSISSILPIMLLSLPFNSSFFASFSACLCFIYLKNIASAERVFSPSPPFLALSSFITFIVS